MGKDFPQMDKGKIKSYGQNTSLLEDMAYCFSDAGIH